MLVKKLGVVVQARMGSTRCPGKVLKEVAGKPLLQYLVERLMGHRWYNTLVVATSDHAEDDAIAVFCGHQNIECFRGPLENVAERFRMAVCRYGFDAFIRLSADSPLFDPRVAEEAVKMFRENEVDLVTNVFPRSFPRGQSVEVLDSRFFLEQYGSFYEPDDFGHVTSFFYRHPEDIRIRNFSCDGDYSAESIAVDTPEDMEFFRGIVELMDRPHWTYNWQEVLAIKRQLRGQRAG